MSRSEEFHGARYPEFTVISRDKDGNSLVPTPDFDASPYHDYDSPKDVMNHVRRTGFMWRDDGTGNDDNWKRLKISHHDVYRSDGRGGMFKTETYSAGGERRGS